ncbi:hypothetical protein CALVIDRAFT_563551 [Calocera viscosa TUFC12733]|uniref:Uncharacterized protein n=1 Tax=Calocera viscosa (strain TUFC12733) TaxID=1330018 RepID=A0A167MNX4_CALVF|nr:hypothetical protein CALVIDRAFT_563551 [Calocera viscosa TUFC12733]
MATSKADILISIKPEYMARIVTREKDHEFRNYLIAPTVERMWFYVSSPEQTLRYIAIVSAAKTPGSLTTSGLGSAQFNAGQYATHAYEILHLYRLTRPLHASKLKEEFGIGPPRKYVFLKRKLGAVFPLEEQERIF